MKKCKWVIIIILMLAFLLPVSLRSFAEQSELPKIGCVFGNFSEEDSEILMEQLEIADFKVSPENLILFPVYAPSYALFTETRETFYKAAKEQPETMYALYVKEFVSCGEYGKDAWLWVQKGTSTTGNQYLRIPGDEPWRIPLYGREEILAHIEGDKTLKDFFAYAFPFPDAHIALYLFYEAHAKVLVFNYQDEMVEYPSVEAFHSVVNEFGSFKELWYNYRSIAPVYANGYNLSLTDYIFDREKLYEYLDNRIEKRTQERLEAQAKEDLAQFEAQSKQELDSQREGFRSSIMIVLSVVGVVAIAAVMTVLLLRRRKKAKTVSESLAPPASDAEDPPIDSQ